ncbi:MAG TPA: nuclear transport factor 2 family protein [Candidatus Acidoferrum sp.]|nr:nuclear transport factor 2 family protein [Candidatus Acidoferrum sp.]
MLSFARYVFPLVLMTCGLPSVASPQGTKEAPATKAPKNAGWAAAEKAVTKLEQEWFRIQLAHDWDKLRQLLGDDFQLIESDGRLGDRDSMIAGYKEEAPSVATISMTLLVSHAVSNDTVVATGLDDISLRKRDGSMSHRYERFTDVWVLRNGQWVCVAEQITLAHP